MFSPLQSRVEEGPPRHPRRLCPQVPGIWRWKHRNASSREPRKPRGSSGAWFHGWKLVPHLVFTNINHWNGVLEKASGFKISRMMYIFYYILSFLSLSGPMTRKKTAEVVDTKFAAGDSRAWLAAERFRSWQRQFLRSGYLAHVGRPDRDATCSAQSGPKLDTVPFFLNIQPFSVCTSNHFRGKNVPRISRLGNCTAAPSRTAWAASLARSLGSNKRP